MTNGSPPLSLDHVVIATDDLDAAEQEMTGVLGRRPSWRGKHPLYGTANVLYRLDAGGAYLELLAVDPEASGGGAWTEFLKGHLLERGPGIFSIAFQTPDVAATVASVRARGLTADEPLDGNGVDLQTGAQREWANARVPPGETGGTAFFFIEHRSPPDALPIAQPIADEAATVSHVAVLTIETADLANATQMWQQRVGLAKSDIEGGAAFHMANAGLVVFSGAGEGTSPHRWQRLVLSRRGLTALADRLDSQGERFEQGDFREGYGLRVVVSGADVLITEGD